MGPKEVLKRLSIGLAVGVGLLVVAGVGLAIADSLQPRTCADRILTGLVIDDPYERIEFLEPESRAGQEILAMDVERRPAGDANVALRPEDAHLHPLQEEHFEILEGRGRFLIGDEIVELGPGEIGVVPPDTPHHWMALDERPVRTRAEFIPALDTGQWFLAFQGRLASGEMDLFQAAVISSEYEGTPLPVSPSPAVWRVAIKILAPIGRLMGYSAC